MPNLPAALPSTGEGSGMRNPRGRRKTIVAAKLPEPTPFSRMSEPAKFQHILKCRITRAEMIVTRYITKYQIFPCVPQKIIGKYFVDFYFPGRKLILELDGPYHRARLAEDFLRDKTIGWITKGHYIIVRLRNEQVTTERLDRIFQRFAFVSIDHKLERHIKNRSPINKQKRKMKRLGRSAFSYLHNRRNWMPPIHVLAGVYDRLKALNSSIATQDRVPGVVAAPTLTRPKAGCETGPVFSFLRRSNVEALRE